MNAIYNSIWLEDIDRIIEALPELENLSGKSILITGANGLICSAIVDVLIRFNETKGKNIFVIAAGRSPEKINARFEGYSRKNYFSCMEFNALNENNIKFNSDYIIHGAGNAYPAVMANEPVETMQANFIGINLLMNYAKSMTKNFVYISSSEVYGQRSNDNLKPFSENDYGYVDILNPRSCYPISKRAAETLCVSYAAEYGINAIIARPGHVYGPTASTKDNRVSSEFAYKAARGQNIVMKSAGLQLRSWCYCLDCASGILKALICGKRSEAYNIPGEILTIMEMSEVLAKFGGVKIIRENASENERKNFNPMNNSSVDGSKLRALGWENIFDAEEGLKHTVEILRCMEKA